jgi:hypothetical protein
VAHKKKKRKLELINVFADDAELKKRELSRRNGSTIEHINKILVNKCNIGMKIKKFKKKFKKNYCKLELE